MVDVKLHLPREKVASLSWRCLLNLVHPNYQRIGFVFTSCSNINVRLESYKGMKKEMVNIGQIIRNFTQFSGLKLRFVMVLVCVLLTVALYAMSEQNILTDCKISFHFFYFFHSIWSPMFIVK